MVVHGGGNRVSKWLERYGIPTSFIGGLRVTDVSKWWRWWVDW